MKIRFLTPVLLITGLACANAALAARTQDTVTQFTAADGTRVTLRSGPPPERSYGPKPAFEQLDANHDGIIDRNEAEAYIPLVNDFDNLAHHVRGVSRRAYARWDQR